jgi:hypothetical protein
VGVEVGNGEHKIGDIPLTRKYKPVRCVRTPVFLTVIDNVYGVDCAGAFKTTGFNVEAFTLDGGDMDSPFNFIDIS